MKATVYTLEGSKGKTVDLPEQFNEEIRPDVIMRAFLAWQSHNQQPYGAYSEAGKRVSAKIPRRRRDFKTAYGIGISRVPRKIMWRRGTQFGWVGAYAPGMYKGRRAHPPKSQKILDLKINVQERRKAIRSALAAAISPELIKKRGHVITEVPSIIETKIESLNRTKDVLSTFSRLKLDTELARTAERKVRAGKGKNRGRRYKTKTGPLLVVSEQCPLVKSAKNIPGIDICPINTLNIGLIAPGGIPGRLTIFTEKAIEKLQTEKLFTMQKKAMEQKKEKKAVVKTAVTPAPKKKPVGVKK